MRSNQSEQTSLPKKRIRFGVNYVPSKNWYYCWNVWRPEEIAADLDAIAKMGVDHLRVMLIWPWFQPNPIQISHAHLDRLTELILLAEERHLDVWICPLTGWLSGYRFLPPNVSGPDIFFDESVYDRICFYFEEILNAVSNRRSFLGFDLGNEMNVLCPELTPSHGDAWGSRLVEWLRPKMGGKWIANGVDHLPWFTGNAFSLQHLVKSYDITSIHAWPLFTGCLLRGKLDSSHATYLSSFLAELCRHEMGRSGIDRPIWVQEFGCSDLWGNPDEKERYMRNSVRFAVDAGASWFTWWCSHDIDRCYRFEPLEYDLGLIATDNSPKPLAGVYAEIIREYRNHNEVLGPVYDFGADFTPQILCKLEPEAWLEQNLKTSTWHAFERYLQVKDNSGPEKTQ